MNFIFKFRKENVDVGICGCGCVFNGGSLSCMRLEDREEL